MKKLFSIEEFNIAKSKDLLPLRCEECDKIFYKSKGYIKDCLNPDKVGTGNHCSRKCVGLSRSKLCRKTIICAECGKPKQKILSQIRENSENFCSNNCSSLYNNRHKKTGRHLTNLQYSFKEKLEAKYNFKSIKLLPHQIIDIDCGYIIIKSVNQKLIIIFNNKEYEYKISSVDKEIDFLTPKMKRSLILKNFNLKLIEFMEEHLPFDKKKVLFKKPITFYHNVNICRN